MKNSGYSCIARINAISHFKKLLIGLRPGETKACEDPISEPDVQSCDREADIAYPINDGALISCLGNTPWA